jgi:hypothetical protein
MSVAAPEIGELVRVRGQHWVVTDVHEPSVDAAQAQTLVDLLSASDGGYGTELKVVWEVEPGRGVLQAQTLPEVTPVGFDSPRRLAAFLDAIRWSAVTSADTRRLQAPFRSGAKIEDYRLEPVARALRAPRVNLLIADDVGLGKTIEAGLTALELLLRHRAAAGASAIRPGRGLHTARPVNDQGARRGWRTWYRRVRPAACIGCPLC